MASERTESYREYKKEYYKRNRSKIIAAASKWRINNRERFLKRSKEYFTKKVRDVRVEAIKAYGNACCCCGEDAFDFLTLDHHTSDKGVYRKNYFTGTTKIKLRGFPEYQRLKKLGWPPIVRVMCMNCNWAIRHNKICPHELKRESMESKGG